MPGGVIGLFGRVGDKAGKIVKVVAAGGGMREAAGGT